LRQVKIHPAGERRIGSPGPWANHAVGCGVQILSQGRDLGIVRGLLDDSVMKMNAFK
jgi:hypothetical protein